MQLCEKLIFCCSQVLSSVACAGCIVLLLCGMEYAAAYATVSGNLLLCTGVVLFCVFLTPDACVCTTFAGMVRDTGEATERFLRAAAAGDISTTRELDEAAQHALAAVGQAVTDPHDVKQLTHELSERASVLRSRVAALVYSVRDAVDEEDKLLNLGLVSCWWQSYTTSCWCILPLMLLLSPTWITCYKVCSAVL